MTKKSSYDYVPKIKKNLLSDEKVEKASFKVRPTTPSPLSHRPYHVSGAGAMPTNSKSSAAANVTSEAVAERL